MKFEIIKYSSKDLNELINLAKTYYKNNDMTDSAYLDWQYFSNPNGVPYLFIGRTIPLNEIAGQYLVIPIELKYFKNKKSGSLSLNTLTAPEYQGNGLFTEMAKETYIYCAQNNIDLTIGFPNPNSYPGFVRKLEFKHLGNVPLLIKPINIFGMIKSFFKKRGVKHGEEINCDEIHSNEILKFDFNSIEHKEKYQIFWTEVKRKYQISLNKDYRFINWRYNLIPTRNYQIYFSEENGRMIDFLITKTTNVWGSRVGVIMDILTIYDSPVNSPCLSHFYRIAKKTKLDFIACLHSENHESKILKKDGFYKFPENFLPQQIHFIVRNNTNFIDKRAFDMKNWKLTFGDYDVF
ncbi:MAG: GNAT family N-acetyltransferase [Pelagibacterales bacterium]|nr:GNAT family N-acetyltransferase [Pelagibacterales bacterium]